MSLESRKSSSEAEIVNANIDQRLRMVVLKALELIKFDMMGFDFEFIKQEFGKYKQYRLQYKDFWGKNDEEILTIFLKDIHRFVTGVSEFLERKFGNDCDLDKLIREINFVDLFSAFQRCKWEVGTEKTKVKLNTPGRTGGWKGAVKYFCENPELESPQEQKIMRKVFTISKFLRQELKEFPFNSMISTKLQTEKVLDF